MKTQTLDIPLKGSRDYIHGTHLFNLAFKVLSEDAGKAPDEFEIAFHSMAYKQVELVWDTEVAPDNAFAAGSASTDNGRKRYWMRELQAPLSNRQPYPEDEIVKALTFDADFSQARLDTPFAYSDIELWVSMIKAMHQARFADAAGKWVFARAKLRSYTPEHPPMVHRVALGATLGTKLTRNEAYLNDDKIGDIFFALM